MWESPDDIFSTNLLPNQGGDIDCGSLLGVSNLQFWCGTGVENEYTWWGGTSASTAMVTGIASLVREQNLGLNAQQVKQVIEQSAFNPDAPFEWGHTDELGYGHVSALRALLRTPGEKKIALDDLTLSPPDDPMNNPYEVADLLVVPNGRTLTIAAGTYVHFVGHNSGIVVEEGGTLRIEGTPGDSVVFSGQQSPWWLGIVVDGGIVEVDHAVFTGAAIAIDLHGSSNATVTNSRVSGNLPWFYDGTTGYGIRVQDNSSLSLEDSEISNCRKAGVYILGNSAYAYVHGCTIQGNGNGGFTSGGIVSFVSLGAFVSCSGIFDNVGPGLNVKFSNAFLGVMEGWEVWGGNHIGPNFWPRGQIDANRSVLWLLDGQNYIHRLPQFSPLYINSYNCDFDPSGLRLSGNYWGYQTPGQEQTILAGITGGGDCIDVSEFSYATTWSPCDPVEEQTPSECEQLWSQAVDSLTKQKFVGAIVLFKTIIEDYDDCKYSTQAVKMLQIAMKGASASYTTTRSYLLSEIDETNEDKLKFELAKAAAEAAGYNGDFTIAGDELDSLKAVSGILTEDSLACEISKEGLSFLENLRSEDGIELLDSHLDSFNEAMTNFSNQLVDSFVLKPTIDYADITALDNLLSSHEVSADSYSDDDVPIAIVVIDYRFRPVGAWVRDTLTQQINDTTWEITLNLDSLGGGLEYRLLAIDTLGRVETWPGTDGYANLNDTLTHFVSFEPRLTVPLTDTAYVYAPGVIRDDIEIGDGGVLYIRPAPVVLDSYVVAIDSGLGISLVGEESEAELIVNGSDSTVIRLECADAGDRWSGISDQGGVVQIDHAELRETVRPLYSAKDVGWPYIRLQDVAISDFALPSFLGSTNSGSDTSFVIGCTFKDGDSTGIIIAEGSTGLYFEDVIIQNCGDDGLVLSEADNQLLSNVRITDNGRYGIFTETGTGNSVRLANCYVAFNGDTLAEIKANSNSIIDVSDFAGNIVKDSTGVLFECAEVNDFDAELGSNSFVLADSTGKYFNVTSMSSPSYITGNTFYPESVNDSTFIADYMKHDTLSKWVFSYLRAENLMEEVIEAPNGSIDFELKAYVQNYLGTVANDTITQVGFKYRLFPDSTNWTTYRQNTIETDSIYDWTVSVGDQGGLISYIWWAKDAHGRFLTSPAGADTTTPDSGATHFISFEMSDASIVNDSVTIWAPTILTHDVHVDYGGRFVIKPWPGASDHTVTLAEGVSIIIYPSSSGNNPKTWILGTESMPITLDAVDDTSEWEQVYINSGILEATYTTFRSNMVAMEQGYQGSLSLKLDHCTFESSDGYFYIQAPDIANSYIRNCVFRNLGTTYDLGSFLLLEGDIEITDSWFYNNTGSGIVLGDAGATEISGCNVIGNDLTGLESYGLVSSVTVSCSEFSYNGGDSVPEVYMWDGTFDFSGDAGNVFADNGGTLLEGPTMASFELDSGGNGFYLFDSTGHYIVTGDNTDTLDITGNLWYPWTPSNGSFQDYFDPDTSRYWNWSEPAEAIAACGVGGMSSMPEGQTTLVRPSQERYGVSSHGGFASKSISQSVKATKSVSKTTVTKQVSAADYTVGVLAQKSRQYAEAKDLFANFINQNPDHPKTEAALSRLMVSAKKSGKVDGLAAFFARQEDRTTNPRVKRAAKFLKLNAMVLEGRSQEALDAYDDIIRNPESHHDSITAVIGATRVLFNNQTSRMTTLHPENISVNFTDMCRRVMRLISSERRTNSVLDENPAAPLIPTSYALYQNYPNPFNPSTEIRFDLPEAIRVELKIFNILGQEVVTLVDDVRTAGAFRVLWDGKNAGGLSVASGVYVYQIKTPNFTDAKKMVLIR